MQNLSLLRDGGFAIVGKGCHGIGNRLVQATVEGAKLVGGDFHVMFDGKVRQSLANIAVMVDNLVDAIPEPQQFDTM